MPSKSNTSRYEQIIVQIFLNHYREGLTEFTFDRSEISDIAQELQIELPKNIGDLVYSYRYRKSLPEEIVSKAPDGKVWVIRAAGKARYQFSAVVEQDFSPNASLTPIKVPDATPGIVSIPHSALSTVTPGICDNSQ